MDGNEPGELTVDLLNTYDVKARTDLIATPTQLMAWNAARGLEGEDTILEPQTTRGPLAAREALRDLLAARWEPEIPETAAVALATVLSECPLTLRSDGQRLVLASATPNAGDITLAALVSDILAAQATGAWQRVRVCRNPACRWAFQDHSRNARRSWCEMATCGSAAKMRAYRTRHGTREK